MERSLRQTTSRRPAAFPYLRAIFSAASFASAPEFAKNTVDGNPASAVSLPASSSCGPVDQRFETWASVAACAVTAATHRGCEWPIAVTAMPPAKSR